MLTLRRPRGAKRFKFMQSVEMGEADCTLGGIDLMATVKCGHVTL